MTNTERFSSENFALLNEAAYLRAHEFQKGKIQLTDSTNAERLYREHGENIRYTAAWKKWLVWNGSRWEVDEGNSMIQEKCLSTIRGLHKEVLRTDITRERIEIEKFATLSENARRRKSCVEMATLIKELNITSECFDTNP